jgi:hypothetical protein
MSAESFTAAELEAGCAAARLYPDRPWPLVVAAVLRAVLPAHDARIRAQAGEDAARAVEEDAITMALDCLCDSRSARIVREVTGASGEAVDSG